MVSGHEFKRLRLRRRGHTAAAQPNDEALLALLVQRVVKRFARLGGAALAAVPLSVFRCEDSEDPAANPGHPACVEYAGSEYCRESWLLHLAQLKAAPETHWHKCDHDRLCALVPVIHQGRCLAVVKLACTPATPEAEFERQLELLHLLVKDFVSTEADFLERLSTPLPPGPDLRMPPASGGELPAAQQVGHPQIVAVLKHVEEHLFDPTLTVAGVARQIDVHPNYLSHLFAEQTGQRLSRFIALRRVEQARTWLVTTRWPIKRIAHETGHANPNWFSFVFRAITGLTPGAYRRQARSQSHTAAG